MRHQHCWHSQAAQHGRVGAQPHLILAPEEVEILVCVEPGQTRLVNMSRPSLTRRPLRTLARGGRGRQNRGREGGSQGAT